MLVANESHGIAALSSLSGEDQDLKGGNIPEHPSCRISPIWALGPSHIYPRHTVLKLSYVIKSRSSQCQLRLFCLWWIWTFFFPDNDKHIPVWITFYLQLCLILRESSQRGLGGWKAAWQCLLMRGETKDGEQKQNYNLFLAFWSQVVVPMISFRMHKKKLKHALKLNDCIIEGPPHRSWVQHSSCTWNLFWRLKWDFGDNKALYFIFQYSLADLDLIWVLCKASRCCSTKCNNWNQQFFILVPLLSTQMLL